MDDLDTFEAVLSQYSELSHTSDVTTTLASLQITIGHSVPVNEDSREVAGGFDKRISAQEDPSIWERRHEKDPVVISKSPKDKRSTMSTLFSSSRVQYHQINTTRSCWE
ncbi:uncharacterized protein ARMOST_13723 [Armillaria ostoyae]|uniref:Uncharacterized protein n=1 Tax=Armillaria ostoyae TaxID=47428 RepID=A0A284RNJ2_ARMOS|nr:uncharacterized protein ARMOST_13723 [Armillaria ostoyae]